jgi:hypothetical protein
MSLQRLLAAACLSVALPSCGGGDERARLGELCRQDADCGEHLCIAGQCSIGCGDEDDPRCGLDFGAGAVCAAPRPGWCVKACRKTTECPAGTACTRWLDDAAASVYQGRFCLRL